MNSATILIVDDEPQIRRVLRTTLTSYGYAVVEARSGDEALGQGALTCRSRDHRRLFRESCG